MTSKAATHNLIWHFDAVNVRGETKEFQCSKPIRPEDWDTPWEAAMFFTLNETVPAMHNDADCQGGPVWHVNRAKKMSDAIRVYDLKPLSDCRL